MARSTMKFLKQQGQFNTMIAELVGCDRHTVARVLQEPVDPPRRRRLRASPLERWREELLSWLQKEIPVSRMLELVRQDPATPYTGGASTFYRYVARVRAADVMSGDVVTVTEDTPVGTIARILEERHIKRVPVQRDDKLVGIVSRADLRRGRASRPAQPGVSPSTDDRAIRERLLQTLRTEPWAPTYLTVIVTDGMVHFWGVVSSEEERDALRVAANNVPGVRGVEGHLIEMTP